MDYAVDNIKDLGEIPPTPLIPLSDKGDLDIPKKILLSEAYKFGYPISFIQEQKGFLIQNIFPVFKTEMEQISTSSKVELALHTETAFHPHRPDYVLLLCLRGDSSAATTIACVDEIISKLDKDTIDCLSQPWFTTSVDKSFEKVFGVFEGKKWYKEYSHFTTSILFFIKSQNEYTMVYDHDLMKSTNSFAEMALELFREALVESIKEIYLSTGDMLILNNNKVVHGRKSFQARYDGTDRWLQRMLVKKEVDLIKEKKCNLILGYETFLIETPLF
jgi:hypothetical protein